MGSYINIIINCCMILIKLLFLIFLFGFSQLNQIATARTSANGYECVNEMTINQTPHHTLATSYCNLHLII